MNRPLCRSDIPERRPKCAICGYELLFLEYVAGDKCAFHSEKRAEWGLLAWLRFAWLEYQLYQKKLSMAKRGLNEVDFYACLSSFAPDIGEIKDAEGMDKLLKHLKHYKRSDEQI